MVEARLFFGDQIAGDGAVNAGEWQQFVDQEVTPRFPAGFTVLATTGQWRRPDGTIARETGHELLIILGRSAVADKKLDEIRAAYKRRFMQDSVLLAQAPDCAGS